MLPPDPVKVDPNLDAGVLCVGTERRQNREKETWEKRQDRTENLTVEKRWRAGSQGHLDRGNLITVSSSKRRTGGGGGGRGRGRKRREIQFFLVKKSDVESNNVVTEMTNTRINNGDFSISLVRLSLVTFVSCWFCFVGWCCRFCGGHITCPVGVVLDY